MDVRTAPAWAALAPFTTVGNHVLSEHAVDGDGGPVTVAIPGDEMGEMPDEQMEAIADMIVGAAAWALILRVVASGGTLARETEGELILCVPIDGYVDPISIAHGIPVEAFEEIPISVDPYGLPVLPEKIYRELARLVGWPVAPAGEAAS